MTNYYEKALKKLNALRDRNDFCILAFESSCDETAVSVTRGREVRSNIISSQIEIHRRFGGVVPEIASRNHALQPFVQLNQASNPEKEFVKFLEANKEWIDWWYKNGDKGKQHYAIAYGEGKAKSLFYVDFIIRMKNGHVYLFDTKSAGSDAMAYEKHNALLKYIHENSTEDTPLFGGIILQQGSNWLYSKLPIENTTDTLNWNSFYPENA